MSLFFRKKTVSKGHRAVCLAVPTAAAVLVVAVLLWPMDRSRYFAVSRSGEIVDRSGTLLYPFLNRDDQWCFYRAVEEVGPRLIEATLAAEDRRFYSHWGVDPFAVARAAWQNLRGGRVVSGASTLTMQVVKNGEGRTYRRSLPGKVYEAFQALRLDARATKREILGAYLNTAPYGLNLVGVEAAARRYFGKPARELTLPEAALIAGLPKAPTSLMPLKNPERALRRRNYVLGRMLAAGSISAAEHAEAAAAPLGSAWREFPALSPHLAMQLRSRAADGQRIEVTIDDGVQRAAESCVARALKRHRPDITNAAVIVVDVASAEVLARIGSGDFYGTRAGGQVDLCRAARSPGSALKPFTYALGFEQNVLYPSETLLDDTLDMGAYSPGNFDGAYNGLISATDALRHSLNVPAVMVLDRVGAPALETLLHDLGLSTLERTEMYGLGLTLGNCEVRLDELTAAYAAIANLGAWRPLTTVRGVPGVEARRVLARGTCLALYQALEQTLPGEWEPNLVVARNAAPRVCFKTGTSTGYHDAWTFVFNAQYVVGVWMGNNDGKGSDRLVGVRAALPLAAAIFRQLPVMNRPAWPEPGADLRPVLVCAVSGLPCTEWCLRTRQAEMPAAQYLHRVCNVHRPVTAREGGIAECWPGSARGWDLADVGQTVPAADSARIAKLRIQDPSNKAEYVLTGEPEGDRVRLRSSQDAEMELYWYINDRFFGRSSPEKPLLLDLIAGEHTLACMAPDGSLDRVQFRVSDPQRGLRFKRQS